MIAMTRGQLANQRLAQREARARSKTSASVAGIMDDYIGYLTIAGFVILIVGGIAIVKLADGWA